MKEPLNVFLPRRKRGKPFDSKLFTVFQKSTVCWDRAKSFSGIFAFFSEKSEYSLFRSEFSQIALHKRDGFVYFLHNTIVYFRRIYRTEDKHEIKMRTAAKIFEYNMKKIAQCE